MTPAYWPQLKLYGTQIVASAMLILSSSACEEIVSPDLDRVDPLPVVDAWLIHSHEDRVWVQLSLSSSYDAKATSLPIENATIRLEEVGQGNIPMTSIQAGYFVPNREVELKPGSRYILDVTAEGRHAVAQAILPEAPPLDSLTTTEVISSTEDPLKYKVLAHFQDIPQQDQYYKWNISLNGTERRTIELMNDIQFDGLYIRAPMQGLYTIGDTVDVCLLSLTKHAFQYYETLKQITEPNSSSITIPQNPKTNLEGETVLGYFTVCSESCKRLIIQ